MFGFGEASKTRGQLSKEELSIGFDHLMQAAALAAGGAGAAVGPRYHAVRTVVAPQAGRVREAASSSWIGTKSTIAPLVVAAREGAREATVAAMKAKAKEEKRLKREQRMSRRRIGLTVGILFAGIAAGAAAAVAVRRRRRAQWEEFDPSAAMESVRSDVGERMDRISDRSSNIKDSASEMARNVRGTASETASDVKGGAKEMARDVKSGVRDMSREARDAAEESKAKKNDLTDSNSFSSNRTRS